MSGQADRRGADARPDLAGLPEPHVGRRPSQPSARIIARRTLLSARLSWRRRPPRRGEGVKGDLGGGERLLWPGVQHGVSFRDSPGRPALYSLRAAPDCDRPRVLKAAGNLMACDTAVT